MVPLRHVALGLAVVFLNVVVNGWDLLVDPLGWLLVLVGTRALPVRRRGALLASAALALAAAAAVWPPGAAEAVAGTDDALSWALSLPQAAYVLLLADGLREVARGGGDAGLATWWGTTTGLAAAALVLPVLVLGADVLVLAAVTALVSLLTAVLVVVLGLVSARAAWAGGPGGPSGGPERDSDPKTGPAS